MAEMLPFALRAGLPMPAFVDAVTSGTGQRLGLAFASGLKALGTDVLCGHGIDEQVCVCVCVCICIHAKQTVARFRASTLPQVLRLQSVGSFGLAAQPGGYS